MKLSKLLIAYFLYKEGSGLAKKLFQLIVGLVLLIIFAVMCWKALKIDLGI